MHGGKTSKSFVYSYEVPDLDELNNKRDDVFSNAKSDLTSIMNKSLEFRESVNSLKKDVLNNKSSDYNKLQQIKQLKEEQKDLKDLLESVKNDLDESANEMEALSKIDESLNEKQQLIEELLEDVMDDELLDLLNKLEDLIKENNSAEEQKEKVDDIEMNAEDMSKQLDRSIEMLKKLQVNEKIDAIEKELNELAEEQEKNKNDLLDEKSNKEEVIKKQNEIDKRFEEIKEDIDVLNKLNSDLSKPMDLGDSEPLEKQIDNDLNNANDQISKSKSKKASESQKNASDGMKRLSKQLNEKQKEANKQQQEEDISILRMILKNLLSVSFDQESVMENFLAVHDSSPSYTIYARTQQKIIDNSLSIRDSLNELAKRQPKVASFIDKELNTIFKNFSFVTEDIDEHRKRPLSIHQQTIMTSFNNLSLLFNESLEDMQSQMNSEKSGNGSCETPGGKGKPKSGKGEIGDMKEMLKKQLEQMKNGSNPGGNKPGSSPSPFGMTPQQFSKMAAQQSMIRKKLESLRNELNKDGKGSGNKLNDLINEIDKQQNDLINKKFSPSLIKRQQEILTRLLESEKALMERGLDDKRESKSGKVFENGNQIKFEEYKKEKLKEIEFFRSVNPLYQKYYKDKANEYFNKGF